MNNYRELTASQTAKINKENIKSFKIHFGYTPLVKRNIHNNNNFYIFKDSQSVEDCNYKYTSHSIEEINGLIYGAVMGSNGIF